MRTTLSLDDDVAALLEQMRKAKDATFKQVVNDALREGLTRLSSPSDTVRFEPSRSIWEPAIAQLDNVWEVLDEVERSGTGR